MAFRVTSFRWWLDRATCPVRRHRCRRFPKAGACDKASCCVDPRAWSPRKMQRSRWRDSRSFLRVQFLCVPPMRPRLIACSLLAMRFRSPRTTRTAARNAASGRPRLVLVNSTVASSTRLPRRMAERASRPTPIKSPMRAASRRCQFLQASARVMTSLCVSRLTLVAHRLRTAKANCTRFRRKTTRHQSARFRSSMRRRFQIATSFLNGRRRKHRSNQACLRTLLRRAIRLRVVATSH